MEFRFDVRPIFTNQIVKVNSNLLPTGFVGDRRMAIDMATKLSQIINEMGEASAKAQGLTKAVTTSQKLRMSNHNIYLLGDNEHGKNGAVVGLLKVGVKSLYVFDENGETKMVDAPCVLDFYVHESRQRSGLGKTLFEIMLKEENYHPMKMAIDRPSDKLIGFLRKHYHLERTIPQMNNFVVYEGFFDIDSSEQNNHDSRINMTAGPNTALFGPQFINDDCKKRSSKSREAQNSSANSSLVQNSPVGRYAAPRPMCSMAEIIHSSATPATGEPNSPYYHDAIRIERKTKRMENDQENDLYDSQNDASREEVRVSEAVLNDLNSQIQNVDLEESIELKKFTSEDVCDKSQEQPKEIVSEKVEDKVNIIPAETEKYENVAQKKQFLEPMHFSSKPQSNIVYSKKNTGLKNISYNVGMAVSPTNKMEFNQEEPESFGVVKINRPICRPGTENPHSEEVGTTVSSSTSGEGFTDQGYFDLKFYHNKLW